LTHVSSAVLQTDTVYDELENAAILGQKVILMSMEDLQLVLQPTHLSVVLGILAFEDHFAILLCTMLCL
jgi:hypothetical protein